MKTIRLQLFSACLVALLFVPCIQGSAQNNPVISPQNPTGRINYAEWEHQQRSHFFPAGRQAIKGYKVFERSNYVQQNHLDTDGKMFNYSAMNYKAMTSLPDPVGSEWTFIGPHSAVQGDYPNPGIGRINCVHVFNETTWFIGASGGGLWKTTNSGIYLPGAFDEPWENLTDGFSNLAISGIAVNPGDVNEIYILTGDAFNFECPSIGLFKTTDGGQTWTPTSLTFDRENTVYGYKLLMNPQNPLEMYACTNAGLYRTTDGWVTNVEIIDEQIYDVEFHPADTSVVYASAPDRIFKKCCGTDDFDIANIEGDNNGRTEIEVTPGGPDYIYAVVVKSNSALHGVYLSEDAGQTWDLKQNSNYNILASTDPEDPEDNSQGRYDLAVYADDVIPSLLYVGGINLWNSILSGEEGTWNQLTDWSSSDNFHADIHALVRNPYNGNLICCNDGGIFVSGDAGATWGSRNYKLPITEFYHIGVDNNWLTTISVAGGAQDNGTILSLNFLEIVSDERIQGGDGFDVVINSFSDSGQEFYTESQYGKLYMYDFGFGVPSHHTIYPDDEEEGVDGKFHRFDTPYEVSPFDFSHVLIGYDQLYYSSNKGDDWQMIWDSYSDFPGGYDGRVKEIDWYNGSIAGFIAEQDESNGYSDNSVFVTNNLSSHVLNYPIMNMWEEYDPTRLGVPANSRLSDLSMMFHEVNEVNTYMVVVGISGYDSLYKVIHVPDITQFPDSVLNITYDLPNVPVLSVVVHTEGIYAGTDLGVFYLMFGSTTWQFHSNGLPVVPVTEMEIKDDMFFGEQLYVSTYGRGMWRNQLGGEVPVRRYVDVDATGSNDGTSWANAFTTLTEALTVAEPDDSLWIAEGTYYPASSRTSKFSINGEKLYGGFNGTETSLDERDIQAHITRLSGDIGTIGLATDNTYRLLGLSLQDNHCFFDGITFSDGYANGTTADRKSGSCFTLRTYTSNLPEPYVYKRPYFRDCVFENFHGEDYGGVFFYEDYSYAAYIGADQVMDVPVIFEGCTFRNNHADYGGAIYIDNSLTGSDAAGDGNLELINCVFENNSADDGGAIYFEAHVGANVERSYQNINFNNNHAANKGGAIYHNATNDGHITITWQNCSFNNNSSSSSGGAIYNNASRNNSNYQLPGHCDITYTDCAFFSNSAYRGGAVADGLGIGDYDYGFASGTFTGCTFDSCSVTTYGGALDFNCTNNGSSGSYIIDNCSFTGNTASILGGAVHTSGADNGDFQLIINNTPFTGNIGGGDGGAIYLEAFVDGNGYFEADSCDFDTNRASNGGAIKMRSATSGTGNIDSQMSNCTFNNNYNTGPNNSSSGGALTYAASGSGVITASHQNCIFTGNHTNFRGAAIHLQGAELDFDSCTFQGNYTTSGEGNVFFIYNFFNNDEAPLTITNSLFENNYGSGKGTITGTSSTSPLMHINVSGCEFTGNTSNQGSCINLSGRYGLTVDDCEFNLNTCTTGGSDGGAIFSTAYGSMTITDSNFNQNVTDDTGGSLSINGGSGNLALNIDNCTFSQCDANLGGAVYASNNGNYSLTMNVNNCLFDDNEADYGVGGMMVELYKLSNVTIDSTVFTGNHSLTSTYSGGALYLKSSTAADTSNVTVNSCLFENNSAAGAAGAVHFISDGSLRGDVTDCIFQNNTASNGGAIRVYSYANDYIDVDLTDCFFDGNTSTGRGGVIYYEASVSGGETHGTVDQCVMVNNQAAEGGAVYALAGNTVTSNIDIRNSTIYGNHATTKCGGIFGNRTNGTLNLQSNNNILWNNTDPTASIQQKQVHLTGSGTFTVRSSDVKDGIAAPVTDGGNNISVDPQFLDVTDVNGTDEIIATPDDGFSITETSPCIDAADPAYSTSMDIAGVTRPQNAGHDMGAYESIQVLVVNCPGDMNGDNVVNTSDLLLFVSAFGTACSGCEADMNDDGVVNTSDLLLFVSTFGSVCE